MRIWILSAVYYPEPVVSARIADDLAMRLDDLGHDVTVLCPFPSRPKGEVYKGFKRHWLKTYNVSKRRKVVRVFSILSSKSTLISRFLENVSFGVMSSGYLLFSTKKPDVVFLNTWPVFATFLNVLVARLRQIKIVRSVQDIYPETLISQRRLSEDTFIYKALASIEKYNYRNSHVNITISNSMASVLIKRYPTLAPPHVISNWHSLPSQSSRLSGRQAVSEHLESTDTVYLYGGNISTGSNVKGLVEAFCRFSSYNSDAKLVIAGGGPLLNSCIDITIQFGAQDRVLFHSPWEAADTLSLLKVADVLVLPTNNEQAVYSVPSKILSYMTPAKPILAFGSIGSELDSLIYMSKCGWFYNGANDDSLALGLQQAYESTNSSREDMGLNGYNFMTENLSKDQNLKTIISYLLRSGM
jgi:glycosyltransferase involved in cell wall biosynthesis